MMYEETYYDELGYGNTDLTKTSAVWDKMLEEYALNSITTFELASRVTQLADFPNKWYTVRLQDVV